MNKYLLTYSLLISLGIAFFLTPSVCLAETDNISAGEKVFTKLDIDDTVYDFTLKSRSGENIRINELRGEIILLTFWASWSNSSTRLLPKLESLYQEYKADNFTLLSVNIDPNTSEEMITKTEITFPILFDHERTASELYSISNVPSYYLIYRDGTVKLILEGHDEIYLEVIKDKLRELLIIEKLPKDKDEELGDEDA